MAARYDRFDKDPDQAPGYETTDHVSHANVGGGALVVDQSVT